MEKNNTIEYIKMVGKEGLKDTYEFYRADWKNWSGNLLSGLVAAFSAPSLLQRFWEIEIPNATTQAIVAVTAAIIGFFAFAGILLFLNIVVIAPSKLFYAQKKKADLYTMSDIEIVGLEPSETDVRPAGILVTSSKGVPVKCHVRIRKLWKGQGEITEAGKDYSLFWYGDGNAKGLGYATLEDKTPELFVLQRIIKHPQASVITVYAPERGGIDPDKKRVGLELEQNLEIVEGYTYIADVEFKFKIIDTYLDASARFILRCVDGKLEIKKYNNPKNN